MTLDQGLFAHVAFVLPPSSNGYLNLRASSGGSAQGGLQIAASHGLLAVYEPPDFTHALLTTPYDPMQMSWWRIRLDPGGMSIAETAPDGLQWTPVYQAVPSVPVPATVKISIAAGDSNSNDQSPGTAAFDSLDICP